MTSFFRILKAPWWILAVVLFVIFAVEAIVMLLLPLLTPVGLSERTRAFLDAGLLTLVSAPMLWWIIIGPLRRIAITEQARSETIVSNAGDGILTIDSAGNILSVNYAAAKLFGYQPKQMIGRDAHQILPDLILQPTPVGQTAQIDGIRSDSLHFPLALSLSQLPFDRSDSYVVIARDLTEAKRSEEERTSAAREKEALRAQQMTTLAQLATGVAHEIRNPLTAIKLLVQANRAHLESNGLPSEDLELVEQEIRRMERSVTSLLEFARPVRPERVTTTLQTVVARTQTLIEGRAEKQGVRIKTNSCEHPVNVFGDPDQLQQLLLNLSLNALDAMPDGGILRIDIEMQGEEAVVTVHDSGRGIQGDVMDSLFKPFVTTKKTGIGLGLGICRRIAEDHAGSLRGYNPPEGGACFELRLPHTANATKESP